MNPLVAHAPRGRALRNLAGSILFALAGAWMAQSDGQPPEVHWIGWAGVVFFSVAAMAWILRAARPSELLRVDAERVRYPPGFRGLLRWQDVARAEWVAGGAGGDVILHLRDGLAIREVLRADPDEDAAAFVTITADGTDRSFADLVAAIRHYRPDLRARDQSLPNFSS